MAEQKKYLVMPDCWPWFEELASSPEMAYSKNSNWYDPDCRIAVMDPDTMEVTIFTRVLDKFGNLQKVIRHDKSNPFNSQ